MVFLGHDLVIYGLVYGTCILRCIRSHSLHDQMFGRGQLVGRQLTLYTGPPWCSIYIYIYCVTYFSCSYHICHCYFVNLYFCIYIYICVWIFLEINYLLTYLLTDRDHSVNVERSILDKSHFSVNVSYLFTYLLIGTTQSMWSVRFWIKVTFRWMYLTYLLTYW